MQIDTAGSVNQEKAKAAARLIDLANGMRIAQTIYVAAELRIADHIANGLTTSTQIACITQTDPNALKRVLQALCAFDILTEDRGKFALTQIGLLLRTGDPLSFGDVMRFMTGPTRWRCWADLLETVKTGVNRLEANTGSHLFEFYAKHPHELEIEANAMRAFSSMHLTAVADRLDLRGKEMIVDIGGGTGEFLAGLLKVHPSSQGILFDLPEVVNRARGIVLGAGVHDRCQIHSGSFFDSVPNTGDVYLLKQVLHDWDDDRAVSILQICRRSLRCDSRLIVVERRLPEVEEAQAGLEVLLTDLEMMVMTPGGRERTEKDFVNLFKRAGLEHVRTTRTDAPLVIFEAQRGAKLMGLDDVAGSKRTGL